MAKKRAKTKPEDTKDFKLTQSPGHFMSILRAYNQFGLDGAPIAAHVLREISRLSKEGSKRAEKTFTPVSANRFEYFCALLVKRELLVERIDLGDTTRAITSRGQDLVKSCPSPPIVGNTEIVSDDFHWLLGLKTLES